MREPLTRFRTNLDRLVSLLPERHPGDLSWPALYGLALLAILAGDLASRTGFGLAVLPAIPIAVLLSARLRHDPLAGFVLAAGLLGGIVTASRPPPATTFRGVQLPASRPAPEQPPGGMPASTTSPQIPSPIQPPLSASYARRQRMVRLDLATLLALLGLTAYPSFLVGVGSVYRPPPPFPYSIPAPAPPAPATPPADRGTTALAPPSLPAPRMPHAS